MHHEVSSVGPRIKPLDELAEWRAELRQKIMDRLVTLDPSEPDTLQFAVSAMLEVHCKPKDLSSVLGPSQTTIGRWAVGQTMPRSGPYRKWLVESLIEHLRNEGHAAPNPVPSDPADTIGAARRRPGIGVNLAR